MRNILVSNFDSTDENVMVFTDNFTAESLAEKLKGAGHPGADVVEVRDDEIEFYLFEPLWI